MQGASPLLLAVAFAASLAASPTPAAEPPHASVSRAAAAFAALEKKEVEKLSTALDALIADPLLVQAFKARDREKLLAKTHARFEKLRAELGVTHWYFLDPEPARTCFLRVHSPTLFGDVVRRETLSQAIERRGMGYGKELGKTAFALRVVKPVRLGGELVGYMELGQEIGGFLGNMKAQTGDDFGLLVDKRRIDRAELARVRGEDRWDERPDVVLIDSTIWNERLLELPVAFDKIPDQGIRTGEWVEGKVRFLGGAFPVRDAANGVVGVLYVRHPLEK